ncbi:MAG: acetylglutamate kinase [Clostridia bacterium]|jgi:acetylglutamate kinase|nr:acetylglutamate kinase [Clostridia bacterium]MDN5323205.1 acetylglutamate kinase [Clostridia bacterium]
MEPMEKAEILIEALPYIKKFYGKTVVIKYGGHAMTDPGLKDKVITDVILMKYVGINPVIVHGGGPEINYWLEKTGQEFHFVDGMRVTDEKIMEIAQMVLIGKINKEIVGIIHKNGGKALGLSGIDGGLIKVNKKRIKKNEVEIDLGFVGEVDYINPQLINSAIDQGHIPVIAPIGTNEEGEVYNINADYVAGSIASALGADKLVLLTDVEGVFDNEGNLVSSLSFLQARNFIDKGIIAGGMIPKIECCIEALVSGVQSAHIINGRLHHALLLEIFTDKGVGTMVVKE